MTTHRNFSNIAVETNLAVGINATQTDLDVVSDTGWPAVPFTMRIEEELILVTVRTGTDFSTIIREYDGTTGVAHTTTPPVTHVVAAIDVGQAHTLVDDEGNTRIIIAANGDIEWRTDPGASNFMMWDESDDRIEIFRDLFFSSNNLIAVGQFSFNNGPDSGDAWEFLLRNAGDSIVISQFDSGIGEVDRLEIIGAGTAVTNEGDIIFYDLAGVELLRFDDSDDQWEFAKNITVPSAVITNQILSDETDLFLRANAAASAMDLFLQATDSGGTLRQRINILGGLGDIEFYKLNGSTVSLMWDNSDDQWEFATAVVMADDLTLISATPRFELDDTGSTTAADLFFFEMLGDDLTIGFFNSPASLPKIRMFGLTGDMQFFKSDGSNVWGLWDESDDRFEIATDIVIAASKSAWISNIETITGDLRLLANNTGATYSNIHMFADDTGGTSRARFNIKGFGDIDFYKMDGTSKFMDFDESDDQMTIHVDLVLLDGVVLPIKTTTGDPSTPAVGQLYVNTFDNKIRVWADSAWRDLATW